MTDQTTEHIPNPLDSRIMKTPSAVARRTFFYLQECGHLKAGIGRQNGRQNLQSFLFAVVLNGKGTLDYDKQHRELEQGDCFVDVVGPLGRPSDFVELPEAELRGRRFLFVAGGLGTAPVYPQVKYLHERGASVDVIVGAKTADLLILREQMRAVCDNLYICTDDGSEGHHGLVTEKVKQLLDAGRKYDQAVAIGPMIMMKFVTLTLKDSGIPLVVSLNTIMVDGTGMCGCCRITVGGKVRFACVEGPEFDGYAVDFDEALRRQTMYRPQEQEADHKCKIGRS